MEFANWFSGWFLLLITCFVLYFIKSSVRGRELFIRRVPGVDAIDEVVGRSVELGRPILFSTGLGGIDIVTLQAFTVIGHVARMAARFRNRVIVPVVDPMAIPVVEETERTSYMQEGAEDAFNPDDIRFLSGDQFAYAAGVVGIMHREHVGATFFFGTFAAESLIMAESGQQEGAVRIAATPDAAQIPFFLATCDYVIIGEEYYAVTALISGDPVLRGSLAAQDYTKACLLIFIVIGFLLMTFLGSDSSVMKYITACFKGAGKAGG